MEEGDRRTLLTPAFSGYPALYGRIDWTGAAREFTVRLVQLLDRHGEIEPGHPALVHLLETLEDQFGLDFSHKMSELLTELRQPKVEISNVPKKEGNSPKSVFSIMVASSLILLIIILIVRLIREEEKQSILSTGAAYINPIDGATYLYVSAGEFVMGSSDEQINYAYELCTTYYNKA